MRISDDRCRPIDEGTSLTIDEEVERMQIAVADDPRRRRPGRELSSILSEVLAVDRGGLLSDALQELLDVSSAVAACEFTFESDGRAAVNVRGGISEDARKAAEQGGRLSEGARCVEPTQEGVPGRIVHQRPSAVEMFSGSGCGADGRKVCASTKW